MDEEANGGSHKRRAEMTCTPGEHWIASLIGPAYIFNATPCPHSDPRLGSWLESSGLGQLGLKKVRQQQRVWLDSLPKGILKVNSQDRQRPKQPICSYFPFSFSLSTGFQFDFMCITDTFLNEWNWSTEDEMQATVCVTFFNQSHFWFHPETWVKLIL